jgi:hypothetical protein
MEGAMVAHTGGLAKEDVAMMPSDKTGILSFKDEENYYAAMAFATQTICKQPGDDNEHGDPPSSTDVLVNGGLKIPPVRKPKAP